MSKKNIPSESDSDIECVIPRKALNALANDSKNSHDLYIKARSRTYELEKNQLCALNTIKNLKSKYDELLTLNKSKKHFVNNEYNDIRKGRLEGDELDKHVEQLFIKNRCEEKFQDLLYSYCGISSDDILNNSGIGDTMMKKTKKT